MSHGNINQLHNLKIGKKAQRSLVSHEAGAGHPLVQYGERSAISFRAGKPWSTQYRLSLGPIA
jgi:hypothetical protein